MTPLGFSRRIRISFLVIDAAVILLGIRFAFLAMKKASEAKGASLADFLERARPPAHARPPWAKE
jgi:hypothetical protein